VLKTPYLPAIPLFDRSQYHSSAAANFLTTSERSDGAAWLQGRHKGALPSTAAGTMTCSRTTKAASCLPGVLLTIVLSLGVMADAESAIPAPLSQSSSRASIYAAFIREASHRFAIPEHWIRAVIQVESGWNVRAASFARRARAHANHARNLGRIERSLRAWN